MRPHFEIFVDGKISQILILKRCNLLPSKLQNNEYNHLTLLQLFLRETHCSVVVVLYVMQHNPCVLQHELLGCDNHFAVLVYLLLGGEIKGYRGRRTTYLRRYIPFWLVSLVGSIKLKGGLGIWLCFVRGTQEECPPWNFGQ